MLGFLGMQRGQGYVSQCCFVAVGVHNHLDRVGNVNGKCPPLHILHVCVVRLSIALSLSFMMLLCGLFMDKVIRAGFCPSVFWSQFVLSRN